MRQPGERLRVWELRTPRVRRLRMIRRRVDGRGEYARKLERSRRITRDCFELARLPALIILVNSMPEFLDYPWPA